MATITKPYASLSMAEIADLIMASGDAVTFMVEGEMGSGKSSILWDLAKRAPDHVPCYVECACKDVGDVAVPKIKTLDNVVIGDLVTEGEVTRFVPNEEFGLHLGKKLILMWDELGKAPGAVVNAVSRIINEGVLGIYKLPEGSRQFATTNLAVEGVGDKLQAHIRNRMCMVKMRKPTAMEWVENYALLAGINRVIIGFAMEYPQAFESFENVEDPNSNHYIFHPKAQRRSFVSPRSLAKASHILNTTEHLDDSVRVHALMGMVGEAAAMDILTLVKLDDDLPTWEQVMRDPEGCKVPKSAAAACMMIQKACQRIEADTFSLWMTYMDRMSMETQALFARTIMRGEKRSMAITIRAFAEWSANNQFMFG